MVMRPSVAYSMVARMITQRGDGLRLSHPRPFLEAAAQAMGIDQLRVIETGPGPLPAPPGAGGSHGCYGAAVDVPGQGHGGAAGRGWGDYRPGAQWDDACNLLVLGPGTIMSYERNTLTNARLEAAGIDVIRVPGGELAGCRGGPRALCAPLGREPAAMPDTVAA
jgi:arginine deiminase